MTKTNLLGSIKTRSELRNKVESFLLGRELLDESSLMYAAGMVTLALSLIFANGDLVLFIKTFSIVGGLMLVLKESVELYNLVYYYQPSYEEFIDYVAASYPVESKLGLLVIMPDQKDFYSIVVSYTSENLTITETFGKKGNDFETFNSALEGIERMISRERKYQESKRKAA